jgi:uncharacterized membrane protein YhdT
MKTKKKALLEAVLSVIFLLAWTVCAYAEDSNITPAPEGFMGFVVVIPLILIIVLLIKNVDMLVAGFIGGVLAMILGGINLATANKTFLAAIPNLLSMTVPILNSAIATAVFKSGGYTSALTLVRRRINGKTEFMAAFIVILQAAATYMSGIGGGSAMVIAPLAFSALGASPELIAAMSIATAVCFTTSPASVESGVVSQLSGVPVSDYVNTMHWFTLAFVLIAIAIAMYGAIKRKALFVGDESEEFKNMSTTQLRKNTVPAIFLLFAVIVGPVINKAVGMPILGPLSYLVLTIALIGLCTKYSLKEACGALVDGSTYILTRLFSVGMFLGFINIISQTGAFTSIVNVAKQAPAVMIVPAMVLAGFAIGFPAGAYVGSILALILPIGVSLGFSPLALGLVTIGVGFGSQISYVNITMQALSSGFKLPIQSIVKGNLKWVCSALVLLLILGFIFV